MAKQWVKMYTGLDSDPDALGAAEFLSAHNPFIRYLTAPLIAMGICTDCVNLLRTLLSSDCYVTRDATLSLALQGVRRAWGAAYMHGERIGDDCRMKNTCLDTIDEIARIPGIGEAMECVGWAKELPEGGILLPNYYQEKGDKDNHGSTSGAKRQKEYRDRKKAEAALLRNVTGDAVTLRNGDVTSDVTLPLEQNRTDKNRTKKKNTPLPPKGGDDVPIPKELDSPAFREAWVAWEQYKREKKKKLTDSTRKAQLKKLAAMGLPMAISSIHQSISQGWEGLFEVREEQAQRAKQARDQLADELWGGK